MKLALKIRYQMNELGRIVRTCFQPKHKRPDQCRHLLWDGQSIKVCYRDLAQRRVRECEL
jgi:hypothetical protein